MMKTTRLGERGVQARGGRFRRPAGGSLVEMALVMPLLIYMAFGLVEFGQFMYIKHAFEAAARDGMRVAVLPGHPDTSDHGSHQHAGAGERHLQLVLADHHRSRAHRQRIGQQRG